MNLTTNNIPASRDALPVYAIDWETYYEDGVGIQELGVHGYLHHPKTDLYMVSIVGPGIEYVGPPDDAPWSELPEKFDFVAHNSAFDRQVTARYWAKRRATLYPEPQNWWCTANMCVFLGADRHLKGAAKSLLGKEVDKGMRGYMKGKTWADACADGKAGELLKYALDDSKLCLELWTKYNHLWPLEERKVAEITYLQTVRGLGVNESLLDEGIQNVAKAKREAESGIPWFGTCDDKGKEIKPTSVTALREHCAALGIPKPKKTAADAPELEEWLTTYPSMRPILSSMQQYRSTNALLKKALTLKSQIREDGRFPFSLKYGGAHTMRWSGGYDDERAGSSGFNIQNLPGGELYGLDLRRCLVPASGHKFVIADFSQIEPRCLSWLVDDWDTLGLIKQGFEIYEAYARKNLGWTGGDLREAAATNPEAKAIRKLAKAATLGAGYGCGGAKFRLVAKLMSDLDLTEDEATKAVNDFRRSNPKITQFWRTLEGAMKRHARTNFEIELPSGRSMKYYDVMLAGGLTAVVGLGGRRYKFWGGVLTENVCQAVARDIIRDAIIRLEEAGIKTLFTVHDEVVCEVPEDFDSNIIKNIMVQEPSWMPGIPLDVSLEDSYFYKK